MEWISIIEKLPAYLEKVLTWNENEPNEPPRTDTLEKVIHDKNGVTLKWCENGYPTHWMPLPKPPNNQSL